MEKIIKPMSFWQPIKLTEGDIQALYDFGSIAIHGDEWMIVLELGAEDEKTVNKI